MQHDRFLQSYRRTTQSDGQTCPHYHHQRTAASAEFHQLQLEFLTEQIALMNQRSFGRKTEKANGLRVYEYLEYVLTELAAHQDDTSRDFLADLLPWSKAAQKNAAV